MINDFTDNVNKYHSQAKKFTGILECNKKNNDKPNKFKRKTKYA